MSRDFYFDLESGSLSPGCKTYRRELGQDWLHFTTDFLRNHYNVWVPSFIETERGVQEMTFTEDEPIKE